MGDSTVGQQTGAPKFSGIDEGSFLSPEDSAGILSSLEEADQKLLGATASVPYDDGVFISPEEIDVQVGAEEAERYQPEAQLQHKPETQLPAPQPRRTTTAGAPGSRSGESMQSDLLSRISGELRSIKAEIGTLKSNYDTMISTASSIAPSTPRSAGQTVPDGTVEDLKKLLGYLDRLLESLPEDKIDEFARSEYFELYRKTFEFFDLV
ncbi:MAG: hypothetical protein WBH66_02050 [Rectinemataceae bacterium]